MSVAEVGEWGSLLEFGWCLRNTGYCTEDAEMRNDEPLFRFPFDARGVCAASVCTAADAAWLQLPRGCGCRVAADAAWLQLPRGCGCGAWLRRNGQQGGKGRAQTQPDLLDLWKLVGKL